MFEQFSDFEHHAATGVSGSRGRGRWSVGVLGQITISVYRGAALAKTDARLKGL